MPTQLASKIKWKLGDKALFEHREVTICDMDGDRVSGVRDNYFTTGGYLNARLFPVTEGGLRVADFFREQEEILHKLPGNRLLNWPSLAGAIDDRFCQTMAHYHVGDQQSVVGDIYRAGLFFQEVRSEMLKAVEVVVGSIFLFNHTV